MSSHTRAMLEGRIVPTLLRMAWPNILVMVAQSASGLIETWFVSRLGTDALAGTAQSGAGSPRPLHARSERDVAKTPTLW